MTQYISKSALVAEIKRKIEAHKETLKNCDSSISEMVLKSSIGAYLNLLHFIDTLEVKEVDLEHEVESYWKQCDMTWCRDAYSMTHIRSMLSDIAKHFFELGLSVSNKAQKEE